MKVLSFAIVLTIFNLSFAGEIEHYVTEIENTNVVLSGKYDSDLEHEAEFRLGKVAFANQESLSDYQRNKVVLNHRNGLANFCFNYTIYQGVLTNVKKVDSHHCDQVDIKNLVHKTDAEGLRRLEEAGTLYTVAERRGIADICYGKIKYSGLTVANIRLPDNTCE